MMHKMAFKSEVRRLSPRAGDVTLDYWVGCMTCGEMFGPYTRIESATRARREHRRAMSRG